MEGAGRIVALPEPQPVELPRDPGVRVEMALARLLWGDDLYRKARPQWPLLEP